MDAGRITLATQEYLDQLAGPAGAIAVEPVVRDVLGRAARRRFLCTMPLHRGWRRRTRPPVSLDSTKLLSALVDRLREARPARVRQFVAIARRPRHEELNDVARRLDQRVNTTELRDDLAPQAERTYSPISPNALRMLKAIERPPEDERDVFDVAQIQGFAQMEQAVLLSVSGSTVQQQLSKCIVLLTMRPADLCHPGRLEGRIPLRRTEPPSLRCS